MVAIAITDGGNRDPGIARERDRCAVADGPSTGPGCPKLDDAGLGGGDRMHRFLRPPPDCHH